VIRAAAAAASLLMYGIILAESNSNSNTIPPNMIGMFDDNPGLGWSLRSESGGPLHQRFFRGSSTYQTNLGAATHGHGGAHVTTSSITGTNTSSELGGSAAGGNHTHQVTPTLSTESNIPPYTNFVMAEKINLTMQDYRWYVDSGNYDVTDPWGSTDIPQNTNIYVVPPAYEPMTQAGVKIRLRFNILVGGSNLLPAGLALKLQFKEGVDNNCYSGTWTDISTSTNPWRWSTSPPANSSQALTLEPSRLTPTSTVMQLYQRTSGSLVTNPNAASAGPPGDTMEYDFHIMLNQFTANRGYTFRMVENNGTALNDYNDTCPGIENAPGPGDQMRHGQVFTSGYKRGFTWAD
jgi:hypothetical protein